LAQIVLIHHCGSFREKCLPHVIEYNELFRRNPSSPDNDWLNAADKIVTKKRVQKTPLVEADLEKQARNNSTGKVRRASPGGNNMEIAAVDQNRIVAAVREILLAVGEDPDREGLRDTPERVARMYAEMFSGIGQDPRDLLKKTFTQKYDEMVLVKEIGFASMCEHHLLPFLGKAHVAYLPNGKIVGLSKIARVVEVLARRPQVQERMTEELADLFMNELQARGVGVILEATHTCMTIRGIRKANSVCTTSAMRGAFRTNEPTRAEFMSLVYGSR
jgi:GTP cyclohydrolase I